MRVELEVLWCRQSKITRATIVGIETSKNPAVRSSYSTVLRNLSFSREQGKDFSKGKGDQIWIFCIVATVIY